MTATASWHGRLYTMPTIDTRMIYWVDPDVMNLIDWANLNRVWSYKPPVDPELWLDEGI